MNNTIFLLRRKSDGTWLHYSEHYGHEWVKKINEAKIFTSAGEAESGNADFEKVAEVVIFQETAIQL